MYRRKGCILAGLLAMALVFTSGGVSVLADETDDRAYTAGLCEHHPEHTDDCGYDEAAGTPCTYECDICGSDASDGEKTDQNGSGQNTGSEDGQNTEDTSEDTTSGGAATAGDTANAAMITDWSWIDEDGILQENDGVWGIGVPGASEDNPLTQDALLEMLPKQINATLSDGSDVTIDLTWDLSAIPEEGVWSGEYTVSANVDGTYSVSEDMSALQVTVTAGGGENYASEANLANGRVDGISPQGTTINVFDYWQTDDADPAGDDELDRDHGINKNTVLKFGSGMGETAGDSATDNNVNDYTQSEQVRQGIVNRTLTDGYPSLSDKVDDSQSSLEYLFSPSVAHEGKASYRDAEGLLQVDDEGYFYYDSIKTFAELDRETAKFTLYEGNYYSQTNEDKLGDEEVGGAVAAAGTSPDGQFFPFASASEVYKDAEDGNGISLNPHIDSKNATIQHYFGLTMSTRFVQQDGGYTDSTKDTAVTYEFSGDDDVWVFIDGVLVADLGGIHDRASLKIDFSTGEIVINEGTNHVKTSTLHQQFSNAGKESSTKWSEDNQNTFADGTYHTLNFYYLERGGTDSNMSLKFNLVSVPASGIIKVDQAGNYIPGAEFVLYKADEHYQYNEDTDAVCRGTTDSNGELIFTKINDAGAEVPVSLGELYTTQGIHNLVLAEETTPAGYRSFGEMHIRLAQSAGGEVFALSENQWDTGAYASGNVRVWADAELTVNKSGGTATVNTADGTLFAVVLQRQDTTKPINDASNWRAVYGDPLSGWHVVESSDGSGGNDTLAGIITAAKENPHIFTLQQSGSYDVDINDLPGDIETYYYVISGDKNAKTEYTVGYYFTEAESLSGATVGNTYRVDSEDFERIFSVNLYVPNIQNNLYVQKLDENGQPVSAGADGSGSATFTLYSQDDVTKHEDGTYTVAERTQSYSVDTSDMTTPLPLTGGAMFTRIPNGAYYLIETRAPEGYEKSSEIIPVVVDNTGIYADAGGAGDDVSVQRGVGSIVHSMIQFATNDDIDATLHNIKADLYTADSGSGLPTDESGWKSATEEKLHLRFQEGADTLNYREEDDSYGYFTIDEGWSKLKIYQCLYHNNTESPKEELEKDQELTNLFSGTVVVQVRNTSTGNLKISKDVVNNTGLEGTQTEFKFTLTGRVNGNQLNKTYNAVRTADGSTSTETVTVVFNAGKAEITLEDGKSIEIQGLPTGAGIEIVEDTYQDYKTTYVIGNGQPAERNDADVAITGDSDVEVTYTNTYHVEGSFTFTKTGTAEEGSSPGPLEGATFAVYRLICTTPDAEGHDHKDQLISIADPETGAVAGEDKGCWELVGTPMTSGTNGVITISGIPVIENTEYRLAELQVPPGFTVPTGQWKLYYDPANKVFKPKSGTGNDASIGNPPAIEEYKTSGTIEYKIRNYRPGELPFSGNTGIRMFLIIGGALMLCGAAGGTGWYLYQRKAPAARRRRKR